MNSNEKQIHYPDLSIPLIGELTPVISNSTDVLWLRMPLPFALDHINLWLIRDSLNGIDGWTAIDTGVATDATRQAWQEIINKKLNGLPILRVLCTHFHPDHMGLAAWLCNGAGLNEWKAPLWINFAEYGAAKMWSATPASAAERDAQSKAHDVSTRTDHADTINMANHFHRHGIHDAETLEKLRARKSIYPALVPEVPASFRRIFPHEKIQIGQHTWQIIPGYGHSPEHSALFCKDLNLLISGDMVLPRISTNMSVWAQEPDANPLKLYLDSLDLFDPLPDDVLVLPSHGKPFGGRPGPGGLKTRLTQLRDHHRDRLDDTRIACAQPITAAQMLPILFRRELDLHQMTFALGETIAHLNFLWHAGELKRVQGPDGVLRFETVG